MPLKSAPAHATTVGQAYSGTDFVETLHQMATNQHFQIDRVEPSVKAMLFRLLPSLATLTDERANAVVQKGSSHLEQAAIEVEARCYNAVPSWNAASKKDAEKLAASILKDPTAFSLSTAKLYSPLAPRAMAAAQVAKFITQTTAISEPILPQTMQRDENVLHTLKGDFERLVHLHAISALAQNSLYQVGITLNKNGIDTLNYAIDTILREPNNGPKELADLVAGRVHHISVSQGRELSEEEARLLKGQIESNAFSQGPVYQHFHKRFATQLLQQLIEQSPANPKDPVSRLASQASRLVRVYEGVHGQNLHQAMRKKQLDAIVSNILSVGPFDQNQWPVFLNDLCQQAHELQGQFKDLVAKMEQDAIRRGGLKDDTAIIRAFSKCKNSLASYLQLRLAAEDLSDGNWMGTGPQVQEFEARLRTLSQNWAQRVIRNEEIERGQMVPDSIKSGLR